MAEATGTITANTKYETALKYKQDGNEAFKAKNFKLAIRNYHKALLYIRGIDQHAVKLPAMLGNARQQRDREQRQSELTEELTGSVDALKVDTYNNLTAALLQCEDRFDLQKILEYCDEVAELSPNNQKCLFRRGQAYARAGDYEEAERCLLKARELLKEKDPAIEKLLVTCRQNLKVQHEKQRSMCRNMFGS
ncbi:tetratricopeptide repeat protein 9C-like isoform X1 [Amphibalanus amphitrite]|uniref:tetratricopeptide repeat protein 9C-like isoform X1 n=1 Tax=Amphibalanus amphitrite TaxID=1232801 RepID=UPI001C8FFF17|nr:tetratricopeptide repeat protein 9C-like isoform X1 [Amphibalanus amphitrite]XP_043223999.1 tetratricopeptide repeat protein 9C-like isoform X1 [Amphibalanus amphitrite]XP_043224000.1 tetratricopeptide repeat protein 9C-like isoform X1 [Amphibalanus amphitrite]XP_043224001.1 tetratricopeptide repeat protein 9C-like isoform X1 [Amphibalanus amphitrite]